MLDLVLIYARLGVGSRVRALSHSESIKCVLHPYLNLTIKWAFKRRRNTNQSKKTEANATMNASIQNRIRTNLFKHPTPPLQSSIPLQDAERTDRARKLRNQRKRGRQSHQEIQKVKCKRQESVPPRGKIPQTTLHTV